MSTVNFGSQQARAKIKEMAEAIDFAMMATNLDSKPIHTIPMSTKKVDEQGHIWFLSGKDSDHNHNIETNSDTQLTYADPSAMQFLVVYGSATITTDRNVLEELYGRSDDNWFEGVTDPNLTAIEISPMDAYYWSPKNNSLVTLIKMGVGAITGNQPDISESGDLNP